MDLHVSLEIRVLAAHSTQLRGGISRLVNRKEVHINSLPYHSELTSTSFFFSNDRIPREVKKKGLVRFLKLQLMNRSIIDMSRIVHVSEARSREEAHVYLSRGLEAMVRDGVEVFQTNKSVQSI